MDRINHERIMRAAVLAGSTDAWNLWYDECCEVLERYVLWRCGQNQNIAEDLVQEIWMIAVTSIRRFDPDQGSFQNWLFGIAANHLRNFFRKHRHRFSHPLPEFQENPKRSESEQDPQLLMLVLADLSDRYEQVLRMKYFEEKSVAEIADIWKETPKAIESLLTRAREALREAYLLRSRSV